MEKPPYFNAQPDLSSLLSILKRLRSCEGADGQPWPQNDMSPGRRVSLARSERGMAGALKVLEHCTRRTAAWVSGAGAAFV